MTKSTAADDVLLAKLNTAVAAVNKAQRAHEETQADLVSKSKVVGHLLLEAKKRHPKVADFEAFLKRVNGLKLSRAYDLMRLAGGRITDEQLREKSRERVRKHRAKKKLPMPEPTPLSVTHPDVTESPNPEQKSKPVPVITESPEISPDQRKAEMAALDMTAEEKAAKASSRALAEFTVSCRHWLPKITVEADQQKAHDLVAELLSKKAEAA